VLKRKQKKAGRTVEQITLKRERREARVRGPASYHGLSRNVWSLDIFSLEFVRTSSIRGTGEDHNVRVEKKKMGGCRADGNLRGEERGYK